MKLRKIILITALAAACLATLAAAMQSDKQPITSNTGRFGDPTSIAIKYQDYLYGVIKELNPSELILSQTKFGVDQTFKVNKKTKYTQDGKTSSFDKLKVGDRIYIDADTDKKTGIMTAKKVISGVDIPSIPSAPQ
ncbi:MAG TPA: DUF5666 domain-containing protein [Terriglobia bacterium]|nr:DUF5666 domain-containing protein [Terriglobia bacterium]